MGTLKSCGPCVGNDVDNPAPQPSYACIAVVDVENLLVDGWTGSVTFLSSGRPVWEEGSQKKK